MESYEKLLEEAYKKIKPVERGSERFEVPKVEGHFEGNKTIITNLPQIASYLHRNLEHLFRFLLKTLATPGAFKDNRAIFQRKIPSQRINEKIQEYVKEFVICTQCGKPDTKLVKEKNFLFMECMACGAKHTVRSKI